MAALVAGCAGFQDYQAEPLDPDVFPERFADRSFGDPELRSYLEETGFEAPVEDEGWGLTGLTLASFYYHPDLKVAEADWQVARAGEKTAGQRPNPRFNMPLEYHSDTDGSDSSPWTVGTVLDVLFEWPGKREARTDRAEALSAAARIEVEHTAWRLHSRIRKALLDLRQARKKEDLLQREVAILSEIAELLEARAEAGEVSTFRTTATRMELARARIGLTKQQGRIADARHALARAVGVPESTLEGVRLAPGTAVDAEARDLDPQSLRGVALRQRYDVRKALARYTAREAALRRQIKEQYPDITLSPGFLFDQTDLVWTLGTSWVVPLFNQNEGPIAEALARRRRAQERFLQLQTEVIQTLVERRERFRSRRLVYREARSLRQEAAERQRARRAQYQGGYLDRLSLLRGRRELNQAEQTVAEARAAMKRAFAGVRDALQRPLPEPLGVGQALEPLLARWDGEGADP